jgi:very-short-patch-repair endonuclease
MRLQSRQPAIPQTMNDRYGIRWRESDVGQRYIKRLDERLDALVDCMSQYRFGGDRFELEEYKASLEIMAYTITEMLAQMCAGGVRWLGSDKARFLSPTIDFASIVTRRCKERDYIGLGRWLTTIQVGSWDFLEVAERTHSWFEALDFGKDDVAYLLWAAYRTMNLLGEEERIPGFTPLALTNDQVFEMFCRCESPIESVLYMQLVVDGLLPPILQAQWRADTYRIDLAIPKGMIAIECDGLKYHNEKADARRDAELRETGWIVLRFPASSILDAPGTCSSRIHSEYPWTDLADKSN